MTVLDVFALIVLIVMVASAMGTWMVLGMLPGKIARQRNHPQAEAINVCGYLQRTTILLYLLIIGISFSYHRCNIPPSKLLPKIIY